MPAFRHGPWAAWLLAGAAATAGAQTTSPPDPDSPPREQPGRVLSDVQPLPAEERESHGAVVMEGAPVRAQQDAPARAELPPLGRNAARLVERTRSWDDVREAESAQVPRGEASGAPR